MSTSPAFTFTFTFNFEQCLKGRVLDIATGIDQHLHRLVHRQRTVLGKVAQHHLQVVS